MDHGQRVPGSVGRLVLGAVVVAVVAFGGALAGAPHALAEETICRGTIRARTVDNLRVPDGATCTLIGTRVQGTVSVGTGATLVARGVRVKGNVQAEGHRAVTVKNARVGGSIQLDQGGSFRITNTKVAFNIQADDNAGASTIKENVVGADVQLVKHHGGAVTIARNTIDGNLQCKENTPPPVGGRNRVQGVKEDQCSTL
jgi:hypothetical protein